MDRKDFPYAVTTFLMLVSIGMMLFGRTDLAVYLLLNGILLQLIIISLKDREYTLIILKSQDTDPKVIAL